MPKKTLGDIDKVSETLGILKESAKNLEKGLDDIKKSILDVNSHLKTLNGTVVKHQQVMGGCEQRFSNIDEEIKEIKTTEKDQIVDVKTWNRTKIVLAGSIILGVAGLILQIWLHVRGGG